MTTADDFEDACARNALRRSSGLPIIDTRRTMVEMAHKRAADAHRAAFRAHRPVYDEIRQGALSDLGRRLGPGAGQSAGGRMAISMIAEQRYAEYLARLGLVRPLRRVAGYGTARK